MADFEDAAADDVGEFCRHVIEEGKGCNASSPPEPVVMVVFSIEASGVTSYSRVRFVSFSWLSEAILN